ncbi:hypothetical protein QC820_10625 [Halomonas mongoliensis]|uniref:Uncharacterized protein n=1 Tax=Halomonas mongoliensis TaxID=321265 RepID=A0ABU1GNX6_9GAMM|nr:hypothetical protein [Halomonas mongoliensis]MDR5893267.1 hypothetical protein [Halomonas mongoliensis]
MKSHFQHFCREFREMRFSAKIPIQALKRLVRQGSETAKFPAQRQECRRIHEVAFLEKVPTM